MSSEKYQEIDFEILREPWNKYELDDGAYIKARYILTKFRKSKPDAQGKERFGVLFQTLTVVYNVPDGLKGTPSSGQFSPEEIQRNIERDVNYKTIEEEWNEYITDDGFKIRVKDTVTRVARTKLKDANGDPVYYVEHSQIVTGAPPKR